MSFVPMLIFLFFVVVFLGAFYVVVTSVKHNPTNNKPKDAASQGENKPLKEAEQVEEQQIEQEEYEYCDFCGALISKKDKKCKQCGAKRPKQLR